jgi:hypothetical protein
MEWKLYHKDGTPLRDANGKEISVHSLTYDGEWMGECSVSVSIENEAPVDFSIGDYLIYRNERFELNYDPGKIKQGRKNALGDSFKYSDIKLNSMSDELARAEFLDVVLNDEAQLHYTALPDFVFYIGSLDDLLDRLQANMNEQFGDKAWKFYSRNWKRSQTRGCEAARWEEIYGGDTTKEDTGVADTEIDSTSISVQNQTVWEGLALVNSQFDVNFITRNREVFVDTSGLLMQNTFKYGAAFGLVEINQDAESDQKIVTRMRAYGSEKNLPNRYYATLNMEVWADFADTIQLLDHTAWYAADIKLGGLNVEKASAYFTNHISDGQGSSRYSVSLHDGGVVVKATVTVLRAPYFEEHIEVRVAGGTNEENSVADARKYYEAVKSTKMIHFVSGVNKEAFPDNRKDYATDHLPNNMACSRLMLPGFPQMSLQEWWNSHTDKHASLNPTGAELRFSTRTDRPWVESAMADTIGVRPGSVFFDTEDIKEKKEEIFPTIKEMEVDGVRIDEIAVGTNVEDNGVFKDDQDAPSCKVELNEKVNFDINALKQSDFSITMTDGMCAGRKFKVSGSIKENGRWVLTLQRVKDIGLYFPYKDFQISKGDHFVLSGIELPVQYVEAASEKLLRYAIAWLIENDHTRHTYAPKIYDIFMARQHDEAMADTSGAVKSIHDTIKEGDIMPFKDEDLGLDAEIIIDRLTIKEENGKIPSYEVSLREDKEAGTLQKMQEQITALGRGSGGGTTPAQVKEYIASEGSKSFLSKTKQDVAQKLIRFWEGIAFGEQSDSNVLGISSDGIATLKEVVSAAFRSGALGSGFKLGNYSDSEDSYLEVDHLLVRKAAEFVKLVIRELQSVGGEVVLSPASMKISKVDFLKKGILLPEYGPTPLRYDVYRCSFLTKRGDEEITNPFAVNDLVRCQTFNIKEDTTANAKNKYYWRRVLLVGTDYIDILALSGGNYGDSQPEVGDELVQMGNTTDVTRQSVLYLSAYGSDSPSIKLYKGVNDYTLDSKEIFVVSRDEIYALASMFKLKVKDGDTTKETTLAEIVANVDGLSSTVTANKQEVDGQIGKINTTLSQNTESITSLAQKQTNTENKVSKIEQTTDKISLQVETTTNLKNCIVGSALRPWDDIIKIAAGLSQAVNIVNGGGVGGSNYAVFNAQGATANTWTGLYFKDVRVTPGKKYTFSIWVKVIRATDNGSYYSIKRFDNGVESTVIKASDYSTAVSDWVLYTSQITVPSGCSRLLIETAVRKNGTINVCRPMLMEGTEYGGWSLSPYDKTEAGKLESNLKSTGIDIENGKITATADKFEVRNNSGETTASVNEKGLLEVGAGVFSGLIRKKMTEITPENLKEYVSDVPALALGHIQIDFEKTGSFVMFSGNIKAMFNTDIVIVPPFYMPQEYFWGSLSTKTVYEALAYIGQTIVVVNNSDAEMTLIGYTQLDFPTSVKYFQRGYGAIVTCYLTGSKKCRISWNGSVREFFSVIDKQSDATTGQSTEPTADEPTITEEEQPKE